MTVHEHINPISKLGDFAYEQAMKLWDTDEGTIMALVLNKHIEDVHPDDRLIYSLTDHMVALGRGELCFEQIPGSDPDYSPEYPIRLVDKK